MDNKLLFSHYARLVIARRVYRHNNTAFVVCLLANGLAVGLTISDAIHGAWPIASGLISIFTFVSLVQVGNVMTFLHSIYPSRLMTMRLEDAQAIVKRELEYELYLQPTPNTEEKP